MNKVLLSLMTAALISTSASAALFQSDARKERKFSCTEMCTKDIKCEHLAACKNPENKCLEKGGAFTQMKDRFSKESRQSKVGMAIENAEKKCSLTKSTPAEDKSKREKTPLIQELEKKQAEIKIAKEAK